MTEGEYQAINEPTAEDMSLQPVTAGGKQPSGYALFITEQGIMEVLEMREQIAGDADLSPDERMEGVNACDSALGDLIARQLGQTDSLGDFVKEAGTRAATHRQTAREFQEKARLWESREELVRQAAIKCMQVRDVDKLAGKRWTLSLAACPVSVDVRQPDMVPARYQTRKVVIREDVYLQVINLLLNHSKYLSDQVIGAAGFTEPEPSLTLIGEELKCNVCKGQGQVKKGKLKVDCINCNGQGIPVDAGVPGTTLLRGKKRLVVK